MTQKRTSMHKRAEIGRWGVLFTVLALALLLTACGSDGKPAPVGINPEVDVCAHCNMAIPDNEHATQTILADGQVLKFDDIGCMIKHLKENELDGAVFYVRDANSLEWVELENATFLYDRSIKTPMGYGVLSFKDSAAAEEKRKEYPNGVVMSYTELQNHHWERNMEHMEGHKMHKQNGTGQQHEMEQNEGMDQHQETN